jgi:hypothetical protein
MQRRMSVVTIAVAVAAVAVVGLLGITGGGTVAAPPGSTTIGTTTGDADQGEADAGEEGKGGSAEAEEEAALAQERLDAWRAAKAAGRLRVNTAAPAAPAVGWAGQQVISTTADDWEPRTRRTSICCRPATPGRQPAGTAARSRTTS